MSELTPDQKLDIVEQLEARGDELSLRAAWYIRLKLYMLRGLEADVRRLAARLIEEANHT